MCHVVVVADAVLGHDGVVAAAASAAVFAWVRSRRRRREWRGGDSFLSQGGVHLPEPIFDARAVATPATRHQQNGVVAAAATE